ncbi:hypothetical protein [Nostoc sp. FACHB-888]|uniref:hypothetical protein n=1 Tax=Nostoc sp. FACHB-888 TaxID=2692842 RepID=UPI0016895047|nr:hypothetical protein [Nostoc sp. FACHB-888]MBD2243215.1 hypothetical protein [Nostoc sp. FACHB-888]
MAILLFIAWILLVVAAISFVKQQLQFSGKSKSYRNDPKNRQLQSDLLALLRGDVRTAKRLLRQQRQNCPGRSDNWYLEKVIYDLERDRH